MIWIDTPIENIAGVSRKVLPALKRLGIKTIRDLLFYFPTRYDDFSNVKTIRETKVNEIVTIRGKVVKIMVRRTQKRRMFLTEVVVNDGTGIIKALWFNQPFIARNFKVGEMVSFSGKITWGPDGLYIQNPAYEKISNLGSIHPVRSQTPETSADVQAYRTSNGIHTGGLVAIYPETRGVTSRWLRYLIHNFIRHRNAITDPLPHETRKKYSLLEVKEALFSIHFPKTEEEARRARARFNFEELFLIQLRSLQERITLKEHGAPAILSNIPLVKEFIRTLSFSLTNAQRRSLWEIIQDISKPKPMNRLLEGDVGSGKTVVAAAAALLTVKAGFRAVFMAPTEILARQHYKTLSTLLSPFEIRVGFLVGAEKKVDNETSVIVGTHALIQNGVALNNLGLVVIDEQHRFGVEQRSALVNPVRAGASRQDDGYITPPSAISTLDRRQSRRGSNGVKKPDLIPHFLSMSATPIPRTLALTIYGDLDLSILDEMPKNRIPVITKVVRPEKRREAYDFIRKEVTGGRQVFVICPRIEAGNEKGEVNPISRQKNLLFYEMKSVKEEYKKLSEEIFSAKGGSASGSEARLAGAAGGKDTIKIEMLHGKMKSKEKERIMEKFKDGKIDILVSTSVVEVGIDVPNATIMMIEGAERFGLAQLHQFRGRVGRGKAQSYCFLFPTEDGMSIRRLHAVAEAKNGFELAEKDLEIRGPGDFFGTKQWGVSSGLLEAIADAKLVREVRQEAREIIKKSLDLRLYPLLREQLRKMEKEIHPE